MKKFLKITINLPGLCWVRYAATSNTPELQVVTFSIMIQRFRLSSYIRKQDIKFEQLDLLPEGETVLSREEITELVSDAVNESMVAPQPA